MGFVFGFDDGRASFNIILYMFNIIKYVILAFIVLLVYVQTQKFFAKKAGSSIKITLWNAKWFKLPFGKKKHSLFLWILVPITISLISKGQLFFASILSPEFIEHPKYRIERKYSKLTEFDRSKILASAPLCLFLFALIINPLLEDLSFVSSIVALFSMLPIPGLAGVGIFFGSKPLYIFTLVFIIAIMFFLKFFSLTSTLAIAILFACSATITYFWVFFKKKR